MNRDDEEFLERINYPQPHNIYVPPCNPALREHMRQKIHAGLKYSAKHAKSKRSKRMYEADD